MPQLSLEIHAVKYSLGKLVATDRGNTPADRGQLINFPGESTKPASIDTPGESADHLDESVSVQVELKWAGQRLDSVCAQLFDRYSRSRLQQWIEAGLLTVDGQRRRSRDRLTGGESLTLAVSGKQRKLDEQTSDDWQLAIAEPEFTPLTIIYEDDQILVINKPAGLVMHPAPGNRQGTLLNALLGHLPALRHVPRAGIVHRLDKGTSGLCVVAKTIDAHTQLVRQLQERTMGREYEAVVLGLTPVNGSVDAPIGRHPVDRKRMAVTRTGKPAITHFERQQSFLDSSLLRLRLETGRTHQIRVHMSHLRHPLIGDPVYGRRASVIPRRLIGLDAVARFDRQALHARRLTLTHPLSDKLLSFDARTPDDLQQLIQALQEQRTKLESGR